MALFVGLDVSVKETSVCVLDNGGTVPCERKVATEPDDIAALLTARLTGLQLLRLIA